MNHTNEPLEDFSPAVWERIRRDHQALEAFQSSPVHLRAKSRLREILSQPLPDESQSMNHVEKIPEG
jgi:hypothetical protein